MILPSKHLSQSRALVGIGAEILSQLDEPLAVSEIWERVRAVRAGKRDEPPLSFDWFVLALTFLHAIFAVEMSDGVIATSRRPRA
jgi:hypothetical protein